MAPGSRLHVALCRISSIANGWMDGLSGYLQQFVILQFIIYSFSFWKANKATESFWKKYKKYINNEFVSFSLNNLKEKDL